MKEECADAGGCMSRRRFLLLAAAAAAAAGCQTGAGGGPAAAGPVKTVDAGPAASYAAEGVYGNFRDVGFFVIRTGGKLVALSSICTHRWCKLTAEPDHTFYCECHGSEFDPAGKVTEGPAKRDLPVFETVIAPNGHLLVKVPQSPA